MKKGLILFFALTFMFFAFFCHAQIQTDDIVLTINPQYPKADEDATASLSSHNTDLDKANISWTLNGKLSIQSVGQKSFSFKVGNTGTQTTIQAQIQTTDGSFVNKDATISPTNIDMLWEATDSYVPPFYEGKALAVSESNIKVVAIPDSSGNGEKYIYNWKQDGNNEPDSSGYGKNFYSFRNSYLEPSNIVEATISDLFGNNIGDEQTTVNLGGPNILFYGKDSNLGIQWEKSLADGYTIDPNGSTIVAEPYFFTPKDLTSNKLQFKWSLGNTEIDTPTVPNEINIKPESGQSGTSSINLSLNNIDSLFLNMTKTLNVNF